MTNSATRRRSPWYRAIIVGASFVTVALIVTVAFQVADILAWRSLTNAETQGDRPGQSESEVVDYFDDVTELREIHVKVNGDIAISVDEDATAVTVRKRVRAGLNEPRYSATLDGSRLAVTGRCDGLLFNSSSLCQVSVEIALPGSLVHDQVRLISDIGIVSVGDLAAGRLEAASDTGDVTVANIVGDVDASSSTGRVTAKDVDGSVKAVSDTGAVAVRGISGPVTATSAVGQVSVRDVAGIVAVRSDTGAVSVCEASANVTAESATGDILVRAPKGGGPVRLDHRSSLGDVTLGGSTDPLSPIAVTIRSDIGSIQYLPYDAGTCGEL